MAQAYYQSYHVGGTGKNQPWTGLLTYFLPMKAGLRQDWSTETDSFFCCHGTMVQANAAWNRGIYYQHLHDIYVCHYFSSKLNTVIDDVEISLTHENDHMSGSLLTSSNF